MPAPRQKSPAAPPASKTHKGMSADAVWFGQIAPYMLFALTFLMCIFPMRDTDFFWHIKTGELIWQKMTIPSHDWYTYMDADRPWIDLHWGFQLLMAALYGVGGANAAILLK
ncbi:MAG: hypothetical protein U0903_19610, partial [Planctomycetales bacterium]